MNYPTLFELLRPDHKIIFELKSIEYPTIAEGLSKSLKNAFWVNQLTLNDCMDICACMNVTYSFTYLTISDLFREYKVINDKIVYNE